MTDIAAVSPTPPKPKAPAPRQPSAKTLARQLSRYLSVNKLSGTTTVKELMDRLKSSIVEEEVGVSLDGWET